jgi:hypothetical protein
LKGTLNLEDYDYIFCCLSTEKIAVLIIVIKKSSTILVINTKQVKLKHEKKIIKNFVEFFYQVFKLKFKINMNWHLELSFSNQNQNTIIICYMLIIKYMISAQRESPDVNDVIIKKLRKAIPTAYICISH